MLSNSIVRARHTPCERPRLVHRKLTYALLCSWPLLWSISAKAQAQEVLTQSAQQSTPQNEAQAQVQPEAKASQSVQSSDHASAQDGSATLNTVVVTANRRREPAREVPMQVDVVSADKLQKGGAKSMADYLSSEPGINFNSQGGQGQGQISIRGVTTGVVTSPTVGVYVDNVPFGSSSAFAYGANLALDMGLLDLNHIEVLRGPQGTLYGAGAMGGLLKYVTNEPDSSEFSGVVGTDLSVTQHGGVNNSVNATLNVPLKTDVAALRVSAFNNHNAGYVNAVGPQAQNRVDRGDTTGGRVSFLLTPTDKLAVRLTATSQNINRNGSNYVDYGPNGNPINGELNRLLYAPEPFHQNIELYSADIEYDFGWARLNAISAYQSLYSTSFVDVTTEFGPAFAAQGYNLAGVLESVDAKTNKFTQEFRLTSPGNQRVEWLAGLYYTNENSRLLSGLPTLAADGSGGPRLANFDSPTTYREYAAYGNLTFRLTPRLSLTGGIRVAHNRQNFSETDSGPLVGNTVSTSANSSDTSKTYLFTLSYKLTENSNVYARAASAYRPGGPNVPVYDVSTGQKLPTPSTFQPDTLWTYEAGYKADLFDKRLSVAATVYNIRWNNMQQSTMVQGTVNFVNAGKADIKGIELSGAFRPTKNWNFSASLSATDARLTQGSPEAGLMSGDRLPDTAPFSATLSTTYLFNAASYPAYVGASARFIGRRHAGFPSSAGTPDFALPAYAILDLQGGIDFRKASLSLYVRNLFNSRGLLAGRTGFLPMGGPILASVVQPRTIGANLSIPF